MSTLEKSIDEVLAKLSNEFPDNREDLQDCAELLHQTLVIAKDPQLRARYMKAGESAFLIIMSDLLHHYARAQWQAAIQAAIGELPKEHAVPPSFTE